MPKPTRFPINIKWSEMLMDEPGAVTGRYLIVEDGKAIKCLTCGMTSWNPNDVKERHGGKCHVFHDDPKWIILRFVRVDCVGGALWVRSSFLWDRRAVGDVLRCGVL